MGAGSDAGRLLARVWQLPAPHQRYFPGTPHCLEVASSPCTIDWVHHGHA